MLSYRHLSSCFDFALKKENKKRTWCFSPHACSLRFDQWTSGQMLCSHNACQWYQFLPWSCGATAIWVYPKWEKNCVTSALIERKGGRISMTREGKVAKRKNTKAQEERKELSTQTKQGKIREQMEGRGEGLTSNYQTMKENRRSEVAVSINRGEGIRGQKVRRANCETHTNTPRKPAMTRSNIWKEQTGFALCCVFHHMKPSGWATLVYECNGEEQLCDCGCNIT